MHRVLLAEDNLLNRRIVTAQLKRFGFEVIAKAAGEEAWEYLKQHQVDLILMDLQMPRLNGIECTERIRNSSGSPNH